MNKWCRKLYMIGVLTIGITLSLQGQVPSRIIRSPLPLWPGDAAASAVSEPSAFLDIQRHQIVILAPEQGSSTQLIQRRFDVPNGTVSEIVYTLTASANQAITYQYTIVEKAQGRQSLAQFSILIPTTADLPVPLSFGGWRYNAQEITTKSYPNPFSGKPLHAVSWNINSIAMSLRSGQFTLSSSYLPGFTNAYIKGNVSNPFTDKVLESLPTSLVSKAQNLLDPNYSSERHLVLAPMFDRGSPAVAIAANYHYGISSLLRSNTALADTTYLQEVLQILTNYIEAGGVGSIPAARSKPTTAVTQSIQSALALVSAN
jgi:hypothetical protein